MKKCKKLYILFQKDRKLFNLLKWAQKRQKRYIYIVKIYKIAKIVTINEENALNGNMLLQMIQNEWML